MAFGLLFAFAAGSLSILSPCVLPLVPVVLGTAASQGRWGPAALAGGPADNWAQNRLGGQPGQGAAGQFGIGILLGAIWSPCVGPTLGAASLLAAQGRGLFQVTLTMLAFGCGVALPLLLLGRMSRELLMRWKARMLGAGTGFRLGTRTCST